MTVNHLVPGSNPGVGAKIRGVAQLGRAPALGAGCRQFESGCPDQIYRHGVNGSTTVSKTASQGSNPCAGASLDALASLNGVMVPSLLGGSRHSASKTLCRKDSSALRIY